MTRRTLGYIVLALTIVFALAPLYRGQVELSIRIHHLLHAVILFGAAVSGLLIARRTDAPFPRRTLWLIICVVAPMLAMILMWPSEYSPLEKLPGAHSLEHLGLVLFGFVTAYAGQQYASGVGVAMSLSLWTMALLAVWGFGISPPSQVQVAAAPPSSESAASLPVSPGNAVHGHALFQQNCSACHGAQGQGGMGPSLINEGSRKNLAQAMQWIENPQPPMPKLYPSTLSAQDVRDVATYVESLK